MSLTVTDFPSPGHSPRSALYYFEDEGLLFLGDALAFYSIPQNTAILFGHGARVSYADMLRFDCMSKPLSLSVKAKNGDFVKVEDLYFDGDTLMLPIEEIAKVMNTSYFYNNASRST